MLFAGCGGSGVVWLAVGLVRFIVLAVVWVSVRCVLLC